MTSNIIGKAKAVLGLDEGEIEVLGKPINSTAYGLMGLTSSFYGEPKSREESLAALKAALEAGANCWNGGELYGTPTSNSLHLLNEYFAENPGDADKVIINIKGGLAKGEMRPDGSPENVKRSIEDCLSVLDGKKRLDLFECARVDPKVPIELSIREAKKYVDNGQLGGICLSECSEKSIRRAVKEAKIEGVEVEFSLFYTEMLNNGVAKACAELEIPVFAYGPLGRGFLTGRYKSPDDFAKDDHRAHQGRFTGENFKKNIKLVHEIERLAEKKGCTPGQIAIAWVKAQSGKPGLPVIIPIAGASAPNRIKENMVNVELSEMDLKEIDSLIASIQVEGGRDPGAGAALEFGDSPELAE